MNYDKIKSSMDKMAHTGNSLGGSLGNRPNALDQIRANPRMVNIYGHKLVELVQDGKRYFLPAPQIDLDIGGDLEGPSVQDQLEKIASSGPQGSLDHMGSKSGKFPPRSKPAPAPRPQTPGQAEGRMGEPVGSAPTKKANMGRLGSAGYGTSKGGRTQSPGQAEGKMGAPVGSGRSKQAQDVENLKERWTKKRKKY